MLIGPGARRSTNMATKTSKLDRRLAKLDTRPTYWPTPKGSISQTLSRTNPKTGYEYEIEVEITGHVLPYRPAKTYGDPDDCYPAEGGYAEDIEAYYYRDGKGWVEIELTSDECDAANDSLMEAASDDGGYSDYPEPDHDYDPGYDYRDYGDYGPDIYDF